MNSIFKFRIPIGKQLKTKEQLEIAELVRKVQPEISYFKAYCPYCGKKLVEYDRDRYESLEEHVFDPNGTPTIKQSYTCPTEGCKGNEQCYVLESGGEAFKRPDRGWVNKYLSPIPSFCASWDAKDLFRGLPCSSKKRLKLWNGYELDWEYEYETDHFGVVLKRYAILRLIKDSTIKHWWIDTWVYLWSEYKRQKDKTIYRKSWNRAFPYRAFELALRCTGVKIVER